MVIRCSNCEISIPEEELPRIGDSSKVLCPSCLEPLALPELTLIAKSSKHENAKQPHWAQARSSCWGTRSPPL